jgi:hypothetical protein
LPSFLIKFFGQKRIEKLLFLAKNGSIAKIFQAKEAQPGLQLNKTKKCKFVLANIVLAETD